MLLLIIPAIAYIPAIKILHIFRRIFERWCKISRKNRDSPRTADKSVLENCSRALFEHMQWIALHIKTKGTPKNQGILNSCQKSWKGKFQIPKNPAIIHPCHLKSRSTLLGQELKVPSSKSRNPTSQNRHHKCFLSYPPRILSISKEFQT